MPAANPEIAQLKAGIAALETQRAVLGDVVVDISIAPLRERLAALQAQAAGQRKLATVLFADVSGFTAISETMDAEIVAGFMNDLWALVDRAILDHGGRIDKHIGDAVMALWGAETAREDDPEMAVRAALAMQEAVAGFCGTHNVPLAMRIGVNTGPVLLGAVGTTAEFTAIGDTVNLASRLEHAAPVGRVLIAHDTYRHVRGIFDVQPQKPLTVRGKAAPVETYVVLRAKPRAFRLATRGVEGVETRMIGRDDELDRLRAAYAATLASSAARALMIVGEAGVGKSRLLYEFDNWLELQPESIFYFKGRATPNTQSVAYSLFRDLFAFRFGILDSDPTAVALQKFRHGMAGVLEPERADVVGHWLGFDFDASEAVRPLLGSADFSAIARAHLTRYFRTLAAVEPVVVLLEDVHWADDQSLDLIVYLTATIADAKLLQIAVSRPSLFERRPNLGDTLFHRVSLTPLSREASGALVDEILQRADEVPGALRDLIIDAAEGNPFYVEELVKMLLDQGVIDRGETGRLESRGEEIAPAPLSPGSPALEEVWQVRAERLQGLRVPPTLVGLLQARLDGLPPAERETLQRAAVIGRLFWDNCVAELMQAARPAVRDTLDSARRREIIFRHERSSFAGAEEYIFKHALLRDVAYEMVLLRRRAELHGQVARWLEEHAGDRRDEYLSLIAEHYIHAGQRLRAAALLEQSGFEAVSVGAWAAARRSLERALALRKSEPESGQATYRADIALGQACMRLGDYAAAEAALERGLVEAHDAGDSVAEAEGLAHLAFLLDDRGQFERARALGEAALRLARESGCPSLPYTLYVAAGTASSAGDLTAGERLASEALHQARAAGNQEIETRALNMLGSFAFLRREQDEARAYFESALAQARANGNLSLEATLLLNLGNNAYFRGDYDAAQAYAQAALARAGDLGERVVMSFCLLNLAQANLKLGDIAAAKQGAREALALAREVGMPPVIVNGISLSGQILAAEGRLDRALAYFGLARAHPAADHQLRVEIDEDLAGLGLRGPQVAAALANGAALDFDAVVGELLAGKW